MAVWRLASAAFCLLLLAGANMPARADLQAGLVAYGKGDFAAASDAWRAAAADGDALASYRLGQMLIYGVGVERDPGAGLDALRQAAEAGLTLAQSDLAALLFEGRFVEQDYADSLKWSRRAAEAGDAQGLYLLGVHYDRGLAVELDYREALDNYRKAAEAGLPIAQRRVGQFHEAGITIDRDMEQAIAWYRRAAEGRDPVAQVRLAVAYDTGVGVPQSLAQAVSFYRWAAEAGDPVGQLALGQLYMHRSTSPPRGGDGTDGEGGEVTEDGKIADPVAVGLPAEPDPEEAEYWLRRAAATGVPSARTALAQHLLRSGDTEVDYYEAFELLAEARRANYGPANALLQGFASLLPKEYAYDSITTPNEYEPAAFCMIAYAVEGWSEIGKRCGSFARYGQVVPLYVLGQVYERGLGVEADLKAAAQWYELAGRNGYERAQNALGRLLIRGLGVPQNPRLGAQWVREAASRGYPQAQFNLGFMHEQGLGVPQNPIAAANWYRRAAQQGHARAQFNLAAHFAAGVGLPENRIQAYKWLLLAETPQGVDSNAGPQLGIRAESLRRQLQAQMTPAEIDKAQRLATEFRPKR